MFCLWRWQSISQILTKLALFSSFLFLREFCNLDSFTEAYTLRSYTLSDSFSLHNKTTLTTGTFASFARIRLLLQFFLTPKSWSSLEKILLNKDNIYTWGKWKWEGIVTKNKQTCIETHSCENHTTPFSHDFPWVRMYNMTLSLWSSASQTGRSH